MRSYIFSVLIVLISTSVPAQVKKVELTEGADSPVFPLPVIDRKKDNKASVLFSNGLLFRTNDDGETWEEEEVDINKSESWLFSNKKGDLFRVNRVDKNKLSTSVSGDQGVSWKPLGELELPYLDGLPSIFFDPDKDRMAVTYVRNNDCNVNLMFIQSSNSKKFEDPRTLIDQDQSCEDGLPSSPDIVIGPQSYLFAVWEQGEKVYLDRSFNDGDTWLSTDILIKERIKGTGRPFLAVDRSEGMLRAAMYLAWTERVTGGRALKCSRSNDGGDIWSSDILVHPNIADLHPVKLIIDQSNGFLYVLYYIASGDDTVDLMLAYSDDGSQTFRRVTINSEPIFLPDELKKLPVSGIDIYSGKVLIGWSSFKENQEIFFKEMTFSEIQEQAN